MVQQAARQRELTDLQQKISVPFEQLSHLDEALTHSSFVNEYPSENLKDNQRLEYLGDAILDFLVGEWLYLQYPEAQEGELTSLRAFVVRTESLAEFGRSIDVGRYLRLGRGEAASGGGQRDANLCAAVEALVGAVYIDQGLEMTRSVVQKFLQENAQSIELQRTNKDAKSYLQEFTQSELHVTPTYEIIHEQGPDHAKVFTAQVLVNHQVWGQGTGNSKQAAQQAAAQNAIDRHEI